MRKKLSSGLLALLLLAAFAGCSTKSSSATEPSATDTTAAGTTENITLKVGFCPGPYSDLWKKAIEPQLKEKGYTFEYVEFSDYVQPNLSLANKEIDVNLFQHSTYLKKFSEEHSLQLSPVTEVPTVAMEIWSNTTKSLTEVRQGATVTVPNDETNMARGLRVLEAAGLIKLKDEIDKSKATQDDIGENTLQLTAIKAVNDIKKST